MSSSQHVLTLFREYAQPANQGNFSHHIVHSGESMWDVQRRHLGDFYKEYCRLVHEGLDCNIGVAERSNSVMPFIVQLNLYFDKNSGVGEHYDDSFINTFAYHIQQTIITDLQVDEGSTQLMCVILESNVKDEIDGTRVNLRIRFQLPYCRVENDVQERLINKLIIRLRNANVTSKLFQQPIGDWNEHIDKSVYKQSLLMYGSSHRDDSPVMSFERILGAISKEDLDNCEMGIELDLGDVFNPNSHSYVNQGIVDPDLFNEPNDPIFWLPVFLSVNYWHRLTLPRRRTRDTPGMLDIQSRGYEINGFGRDNEPKVNVLAMCDIFIRMWKVQRVLTFQYWLSIGEALYDADEGDESGCTMWVDITNRAIKDFGETPEYLKMGIQAVCDTYYYTFKLNRITVKTLAWHAREDSLQAYTTWHKDWCRKAMEQAAMQDSHTDVAKALYRVFWLDFICTYAGKRVIWYQFSKHSLKENPNGYSLRKLISTDFVERFMQMRTEISIQIQKTQNDADRREGEIIIGKIGKLIFRLKSVGYKSSIMTEVSESFMHDELDDHIDNDPEILGLPNGVIITTENDIEIRRGRPEDYVTRNTSTPYRKDFTWDHPMVKSVIDWLRKVFVDDVLFNYFMKFAASLLRGGNNDKRFPAWSGDGDNSKSMLVKLFECVLGSYCIKMPVSMATGGRGDGNGPSPALARSRATRVCFLEEPEDDSPFKGGFLKHMTGSDSFFARLLKKNGGDIKPFFKLILMCNKPPSIPNGGKAMRNRFCIIPFISTWVDNPPESIETQYKERLFKLDPFFEKRIPPMATAMLWVMVNYYGIYIKEGIRESPEVVKQVTQQYWEDNDVYYQFTAENIEPATTKDGVVDTNSIIDVFEIYESYKSWHRSSFPGLKLPDKPKVVFELSSRWGRPTDGSWSGIKFKQQSYNRMGNVGGDPMNTTAGLVF